MKRALLSLSILILISLACDMSVVVTAPTGPATQPTSSTPPATGSPATLAPNPTATALPSFEGVEVTVNPLRIVLPPELASGARGEQFPRAEGEVAPWEITPGHTQLKLEGYVLQNRFHEPQIYVYPASAYAEMFPAAFESMHRLNNILYDPGAPVNQDQLPLIPFFNAGQVFASHIQVISFQNGRGVRFLTQYAQDAASANNHDLFYHFQGLTADGAYYVVAILPASAPVLAETSDPGAPLPSGGVPYPYMADPNADMQSYYRSVIDVLNATPDELFTPTLNQLDLLIQSMRIAP